MRTGKVGVFALIVAVAGFAGAQGPKPAAKAAIFGQNLLKNANIEAPIVDPNKVSGWTDAKGLQHAVYGSVSGEWDWGLTGCPGCGKQYLRLDFEGVVHDLSTSQTINVSAAAEKIDAGKVTAHPSAWLGAFHNSDTTSMLELAYQDASGKNLGTLATTPLNSQALPPVQSGDTAVMQIETKGAVPAGTRKIVFTWHAKATGESGQYLAVGDNFSLALTAAD